MQEIIITILISTGSTTGVLFLLFKVWFEKRIERTNQLQIAEFKHKLELAAVERNLRFSRTYERTADTVATTYQKLLELEKAADNYTLQMPLPSPDKDRQKLLWLFQEASEDFLKYYPPNKIYLPKYTANKVWEFYQMLQKTDPLNRSALEILFTRSKNVAYLENSRKEFSERPLKLRELLSALEDDFQKILGFPI